MTYNRQPAAGNKTGRRLLNALIIGIIIYLAVGIALYFLQERFLLHPVRLPAAYSYHFSRPFSEENVLLDRGYTLNYVRFFPSGPIRKGLVLYFHGNSENINRYEKFTGNFTNNGYEVWMPDYPGFGKSTGKLTEKKLYELADLLYMRAGKKYTKDQIIIYGKSLGTGIAARLASVKPCKTLILETPYYSIPDLFSYYVPVYPTALISNFKLPVHRYLENVTVPVTVFHGTADKVIPYRCAAKLKTCLKPTDEFITIPGGRHNNLNDFEVLHTKINTLLQ